jgi:hypothetical protein
MRIESGDKSLNFCTDAHQLEKQMLELSPSDAELTKEFIRLINGRSMMGAMSLKPAEMTGFLDKLKTMVAILPSGCAFCITASIQPVGNLFICCANGMADSL